MLDKIKREREASFSGDGTLRGSTIMVHLDSYILFWFFDNRIAEIASTNKWPWDLIS